MCCGVVVAGVVLEAEAEVSEEEHDSRFPEEQ